MRPMQQQAHDDNQCKQLKVLGAPNADAFPAVEHPAVSHDSRAAFGKASASAWLLLLGTWLPRWTATLEARIERHTETREADVEAIEKQPAMNREREIDIYIYIY